MSGTGLERERLSSSAEDVGEFRTELLGAIDDEIEAVEACRQSGAISVGPGRLLHKSLGRTYYAFDPPRRPAGMKEGRAIGFEAGSNIASGIVDEISDSVLVLALDRHLGHETPPGRIISDTVWLLRALQLRLADITSSEPSLPSQHSLPASATRVIGLGSMSVGGPPRKTRGLPPGLNADQRRLIELAQSAPASYLWGPGGTGKTETLAQLVMSCARAGLRSLVTAPANFAIDGLLSRVVELARREPWWEDGAILRLGPADAISLNPAVQSEVFLKELIARRIGPRTMATAEAFRRESERLVARSRILATTIHQTYLSPLLTQSFWDVLIVDEASMTSPAALVAATSLAGRYVIAGDFRQLPPVVHARSVRARTWLRRDAFEAVGIPDDIARGDYPEYLVMLREQYRMAPAICELVSDAYEGQLRTHPSVMARKPGPLGVDGVLYIDSSVPDSHAEFEGRSRLNPFHVQLTASLFERILERRALSPGALRDALVITPFVAQAQALDTELRNRFGRCRPRVCTVHQSQGREADLVVLDLVDAPNARVSAFLRGRDFASEGGRLQTVAVTRARKNLVIIAHFGFLLHDGAAGPVARGLLEKVAAHGRQIGLRALCRPSHAA